MAIYFLLFAVSSLAPTQKEAAILVATYYTASAIQSPEVQKVIVLAKAMANQSLDEAIEKHTKPVK